MRIWQLTLICLPLMLTGCQTNRIDEPTTSSDVVGSAVPLPDDDSLAKALARFGQARLYEGEEGPNSEKALMAYQMALEADPANHELATRVAMLALRRRAPEIAVAALTSSYQYDVTDYTRTVDLAAAYQADQRWDDAINQYQKALAIDPTPTAVYIAQAGMLFRLDRDTEALESIGEGYRHAEEPALLSIYLYEQARRFIANEDFERGIGCFEKLRQNDSDERPGIHLVLAELYQVTGNSEQAVAVLESAIDQPDPPPEVYTALAISLYADNPKRATDILEKAETKFQSSPDALFQIGIAYTEFKRPNEVVRLLEASREWAIQQAPTNASPPELSEPYYLILAAAYDDLDRQDKAEALLIEAIEKMPDSHRCLNFLAYLWAEENRNLEKALTYSVRSLTHAPDNPAYIDTLGWIYYRMERYEEALETVTKAYQIAGDDAEILLHLGDIQAALGNLEIAIAYWKHSAEIDPSPRNRATRQIEKHQP